MYDDGCTSWLPPCACVFVPDCVWGVVFCGVDCGDELDPSAELVEPDSPSNEYHPLFCRNVYQSAAPAHPAHKEIESAANNAVTIMILFIPSPLKYT